MGGEDTLETGVDDSKRGGLKGRYAMEALLGFKGFTFWAWGL